MPPEDSSSGVFGRWDRDGDGRVCYRYDPPPEKDAPHEDHWHLIGNDRINVTCHNGGYIQIYDWSRGPKILNRWDPDHGNWAGGFKIVTIDGVTFPTLKAWLPEGATMERTFGQGYFRKVTRFRGVTIVELIGWHVRNRAMLHNDARFLFENEPHSVPYVDVFQPNIHNLIVAPIMTMGLDGIVERLRSHFNRNLTYRCEVANQGFTMVKPVYRNAPASAEFDRPAFGDRLPEKFTVSGAGIDSADMEPAELMRRSVHGISETSSSLADLAGPTVPLPEPREVPGADESEVPGLTMADVERPAYPAGLALQFRGEATSDFASTFLIVDLDVPDDGAPEEIRKRGRVGKLAFRERQSPIRFQADGSAALARELEWHANYLQAGCLYHEYYDCHFVDQGSAYGYLQGGSGAPRDFALFIIPLVYLRPDIAKDMLRMFFRLQRHKDGGFPYAFFGYGKASGGGVHSLSSDLDLFVMLALAEYLNVTRDFAFLEEENWYSPKADGVSAPVIEHVRASWKHLRETIGTGPHGMIRAGTGDWNDVLLGYSRLPPVTVWRGESSLNAGLATVALPAIAEAIEPVDAAMASEMRAFAEAQATALRELWTGKWVARGYLGYFGQKLGEDRIFLDTQAWGVLGGVWDETQRDTLFDHIQRICIDPQPAGALALYPPMRGLMLREGSDTNGGTWAAVDCWTVWAWMQHDPQDAWNFFLRTTMAARTDAYPDTWYSVWSGPDSYNAHYHKKPNETFNHNATPMALFPVMNMNRHAGPLLDIIKFAGFGARDGRIVVDPKMPQRPFALRLPLMGCAYTESECQGYYEAVCDGEFAFAVRVPEGDVERWRVSVDVNAAETVLAEEGFLRFERMLPNGERVSWRVERG